VNKAALVLALTSFCALLSSCSPKADPISDSPAPIASAESAPTAPAEADFAAVGQTFQRNAQTNATQMLVLCQALQEDIERFLDAPQPDLQLAAQTSYRLCYQSWALNQLYVQLPFTAEDKKTLVSLLDLINTRPFLPGYIDSIPLYPYSGLIHEKDIPIGARALLGQHRLMDEDSAALGFPVLEFFLWRLPIDDVWQLNGNAEANKLIERRHQYLRLATRMLMADLSAVSARWETGGSFGSLPVRAQLVVVLASLQRLTMVALVAELFDEQVIGEPEWHHPAMFSGAGRDYPVALLSAIEQLVGEPGSLTPFDQWFDSLVDRPVMVSELQAAVAASLTAVQQLPENYPDDSSVDAPWLAARQQLVALAQIFSQLSDQQQVPIFRQ
jgi:hypothetical protein